MTEDRKNSYNDNGNKNENKSILNQTLPFSLDADNMTSHLLSGLNTTTTLHNKI